MSQLQFYSVKSPCITEAKHQSHPAHRATKSDSLQALRTWICICSICKLNLIFQQSFRCCSAFAGNQEYITWYYICIHICIYSWDMTLKLNQFLQHTQKLRYEKDAGQWFTLRAASSLIWYGSVIMLLVNRSKELNSITCNHLNHWYFSWI